MSVKLSDLDAAGALEATNLLYIVQNLVGKKVALSDILKESNLTLSDITTGNVSILKHGFVPKAPNDVGKFLNGQGEWVVPAGVVTLPNSIILESGSTWTDVLTAYAAVQPGQTIFLPNEEIIQTSVLVITKPCRIVGTGPLSAITMNTSLSFQGSGQQIAIQSYTTDVYAEDVYLESFILKQDRTAGTFRHLGISIQDRVRNCHINRIHFEGITQSNIVTRHFGGVSNPNSVPDGIYITNCTADEFWESWWEHRNGSIKNLYLINNTGTTSSANANASISRPSGFFLNLEGSGSHGLCENIYMIGNTMTGELADVDAHFINSIGVAVRENGYPDCRYNNINIHHNTFDGWDLGGVFFRTQRGGPSANNSVFFPGAAYQYISNNVWVNCGRVGGAVTVDLIPTGNSSTDRVFFTDNDIYKRFSGQVAFRDTAAFTLVPTVQVPANRIHEP